MRPPSAGRLALAFAAFAAVYVAAAAIGMPAWLAHTTLALPATISAALLWRRARREASGRPAAFFRLLALSSAAWAAGALLWAASELLGGAQGHARHEALQALSRFPLVAFLVPLIGAVAVRPYPRTTRREAVVIADQALLLTALSFVFLRFVFLPLAHDASSTWRWVNGLLCFAISAWAAAAWRLLDDIAWKRAYGLVALFGLTYGVLATGVTNLLMRGLIRLGGAADLAWALPFALLGLAALAPLSRAARPVTSPLLIAVAVPGPLLMDELLAALAPLFGIAHHSRPLLLVCVTALLALECAVRLYIEDQAEARFSSEERDRAEEGRRAARLGTLASLSASLVEQLERSMGTVVREAEASAPLLGEKADRVLEQAHRARSIVQELAATFRPPAVPRQSLDVGRLLEDTIRAALDEGLGLHVSLAGARRLPPVTGDPGALGVAILQLVRNAAQSSPGGVLRIGAESDERVVALRFQDDGGGVPVELRHRIFDPFFTTRTVGEGVGLGLTQVHFIARQHGGSVVLESGEGGACFVLRLPIRERRSGEAARAQWPLAAAVLASAVVAAGMAVLPTAGARLVWSVGFQIAAGAAAAGALAWTASRSRGRTRAFWALLASGPALWALVRMLRVAEGGLLGRPTQGVWHIVLIAAADSIAAAALLLRPDRPRDLRASLSGLSGTGALMLLAAYLHLYLVVLPRPFVPLSAVLRDQVTLARGVLQLGLAAWAFVLARRSSSRYWRSLYARLGLALGAWAVGQTIAGYFRSLPGYEAGRASDLGWIVPYLLLAALASMETLRGAGEEDVPLPAASDTVSWRLTAILTLTAIPLFHGLWGASGWVELDGVRQGVTLATLVLIGLAFGAREALSQREERLPARALPVAARALAPAGSGARLLRVVGSAVYELSSHLSGIAALARLVLAQSDVSARVRGDAERVQSRAESANRIVGNLIHALPGGMGTPEIASLNRLVEEVVAQKASDLEQESIVLRKQLAEALPATWISVPAIRQVLLSCVDNAAVAIRSTGRSGSIELSTALEDDHMLVRIRDDGPGLPRAALSQLAGGRLPADRREPDLGLSLGREIVAQHGGTLAGRNRSQGGAELTLRLPLALSPDERRATPAAANLGVDDV